MCDEHTDKEISAIDKKFVTSAGREYFSKFANYIKGKRETKYHYFAFKYSSSGVGEEAYDYATVCKFAYYLFNEEFIQLNGSVKKALENTKHAQMWLYFSAHYVCGWRASDITSAWEYLNLKDDDDLFPEINRTRIEEDILAGTYSDDLYSQIAKYISTKIEVAGRYPSKTSKYHPSTLTLNITPSLQPFFGRLMLIIEANETRTGRGYMGRCLPKEYNFLIEMENFFGRDIKNVFSTNFHSRQMNKSYLQSIERVARELDYGPMVSYMVAGYARNHKHSSITSLYLQDHSFDGETAEVVLWCMFERGVMGVLPYKLLQTAYPEVFNQLPKEYQTKLIQSLGMSPYEMEVAIEDKMASLVLQDNIEKGNADAAKRILLQMYRISQDYLAKKIGVSRHTIIYWEKNDTLPRYKKYYAALSEILEIPVSELLNTGTGSLITGAESEEVFIDDKNTEAQKTASKLIQLFSGGEVSEAVMDRLLIDIQQAYVDAKEKLYSEKEVN